MAEVCEDEVITVAADGAEHAMRFARFRVGLFHQREIFVDDGAQ